LHVKRQNEQVSRNRRKFYMKYGFDIIHYVNLSVAGNPEEEIVSELNILPEQFNHFKKDLILRKNKSKNQFMMRKKFL